MKNNPLLDLAKFRQAIWIDYIQRSLITSGTLKAMIEKDGLKGMTSNPAIFEKAIVETHDYDNAIQSLARRHKTATEMYEALTQEDIQKAADEFLSVYKQTDGVDGYVSLEVNPHLAHDTEGTIAEARRLWKAVKRPNIYIKVPATIEGLPAITTLIRDGINVNATLLFGLPRYSEVAKAFLTGLEERAADGKSLQGISSVASFFLSRIDVLVDPILEKIIAQGSGKAEAAKKLHGEVAIASAKIAYQMYKDIFAEELFAPLKDKGARPQRVLWASTGTKNPAYSDTKYVEPLIGPDTVNTVPLATFEAYKDHGKPALSLEQDIDKALWVYGQLSTLGIDINKSVIEDQRKKASLLFPQPQQAYQGDTSNFLKDLQSAFYVGMIITYAEGMSVLKTASEKLHYQFSLDTIAKISNKLIAREGHSWPLPLDISHSTKKKRMIQ
jgi:transaldolase